MAVEPDPRQMSLAAHPVRPAGAPLGEAQLSPYLPYSVLERLQQSPPGQRRASLDRFDGVVLFTDLAGFSRMTDQFSARGPEGVEQLSSLLDTYFGSMTEIALDHGGDVVDFVGDAIVVMWPGGGKLADSAAAAAACGLALQSALLDVVLATQMALQQRISIAAGELAQFIVGGDDGKWRWLLAGEPMRQAGAVNHQALPGQVLICDSAWELIRTRCSGRSLDTGHVVVERFIEPVQLQRRQAPSGAAIGGARLDQFVAQPLLERHRAGHGDWLGEFRNISALFVGFPQLDLSTPGALATVQYATECLQRELGRYGGSLEVLAMDDKGLSALGAFGLPAGTHEDDSARAVRCAMALSARLKARDLACSAGITHGRAYYGESGGASRRHVTLVGGVVNLAARLMQTADGRILCDEATRSRAARVLGFAPAAPLTVKGQSQSVAVYTPGAVAEPEPAAPEGPIIGRVAERERIAQELDALQRGRGGLLLLSGEAGIGKSRLLREALHQARQRGVRVLYGHAVSIEAATPYFAWRRLLQQVLLGEAPFEAAAACEELRLRFEGEERLSAWLPLLGDVLPLTLPDSAITRQMESAARASSIRTLLVHLLRRLAAERPSLLLIDDLHWCDEASAGVLAAVIEAVPRLLVLAGTRPPERATAEATVQLLHDTAPRSLPLEQLPRDEHDLLACHKLGVGELPRELGDFMFGRTGGNPFYSEELLLALREAGLVGTEAGACTLSPEFLSTGLATMPTTLHGVIVSRVDKLPPAEQLTLKLLSVIGREFSLDMLRQLHPVAGDAADLEQIFAALLAADILRPAATAASGEYGFKHAILREVIYDLLPYAQRRQFHREVARWIESRQAQHLEPHYGELALHWEKAGEVGKAIDYLEKAGALAFNRFANRLAIQHIRKAQALAQRHTLRLERERVANFEGILGDSHQELFEYDTAAGHFKACLAHYGMPATATPTALVLGLLRQLMIQVGLRLGGRKSPPGSPQAGNPGVQRAAHIYQRLAESSFFDNRPLDLLYQIMASVNLAERCGATREIVDGFGAIAVVAVAIGLRRGARYYNRRSMEITRDAASPGDAAYGYLVDMVYQVTLGQWQRQAESLPPSEAIYRRLGGTVRWQMTQSITYTGLICQGRYADAEVVMQGARAEMSADVPRQVLSFWHCSMIDLALARRRPLEPLIGGLLAAQGPDLHRADRMRSLGLIARARQRLGQRAEALAVADEALQLIRQSMPMPWHVADGIAAVADLYMDLWQEDRAEPRLLRQAGEVCRKLLQFGRRVPCGEPVAALRQARWLHLQGKTRRAELWWKRALEAARRIHTMHDEALALYQMGLALPAARGGGGEALRQAQALFQRIGAEFDGALCAEALARPE